MVRIIFTERRRRDAENVARRLQRRGARTELSPTSDDGNDPHRGRLYTKAGFERHAARIVEEVAGVQRLTIDLASGSFDQGQNFNLWIVH